MSQCFNVPVSNAEVVPTIDTAWVEKSFHELCRIAEVLGGHIMARTAPDTTAPEQVLLSRQPSIEFWARVPLAWPETCWTAGEESLALDADGYKYIHGYSTRSDKVEVIRGEDAAASLSAWLSKRQKIVPMTIPWLCGIFAAHAPNERVLAATIRRLMPIAHEQQGKGPRGVLSHVIRDTVVKSFYFDDGYMPSSLPRAYAEATPLQSYEYVQQQISQTLGRLLVGEAVGKRYPLAFTEQIPKEKLISAIRAYDRAKLIADSFWPVYCLTRPAMLADSRALDLIHSKIRGREGIAMIQRAKTTMPNLESVFLSAVTQACTMHEDRYRERTLKTVAMVHPDSISFVDIRLLVNEANRIASWHNDQQGTNAAEGLLFPRFLFDDKVHISQAFLCLLGATRDADQPEGVRARFAQQDLQYAEIRAAMSSRKYWNDRQRRLSMSLANIALRFPEASLKRMKIIRAAVNARRAYALHQKDQYWYP